MGKPGITSKISIISSPDLPTVIRQEDIFLPLVIKEGPVKPVRGWPATVFESTQQQEIYRLLLMPPQQRTKLTVDSRLIGVARDQCFSMIEYDYFGHVNPEGLGANCLVCFAGFSLPGYYLERREANFIESLGAGQPTAQALYDALVGSEGHRRHVLGEIDFYRNQTHIGVGFVHAKKSRYRYYCSVIITERV